MEISMISLTCFVLGLAAHVMARVDAIARAKNSPWANSYGAILKARAVPIAVRSACCLAFFVLWLQGQLADTLMKVGIELPQLALNILDLHVGGALAFIAGLGFDSALGYIPKLSTSIPPPIDDLSGQGQGG